MAARAGRLASAAIARRRLTDTRKNLLCISYVFHVISIIHTTKLTAGLSAGLSALGWYSNYRAGSSNYLADKFELSALRRTREADDSTISLVLPGW